MFQRLSSNSIKAPEFFNIYVVFAVILFVCNNIWFKSMYHNWLTGKLSDFTFCFFFPLYFSAIISLFVNRNIIFRVYLGSLITFVVFTLVKTSKHFSDMLNGVISPLSEIVFSKQSINIADPTDMLALPFILLAILLAHRVKVI